MTETIINETKPMYRNDSVKTVIFEACVPVSARKGGRKISIIMNPKKTAHPNMTRNSEMSKATSEV